jgi:hypothetical protein
MLATISYQKAQALLFGGGSVQVPEHPDFDLQRQLTLAAWVLPVASPGPVATILSKGAAAYELDLQGGKVVITAAGAQYSSTGSAPVGQWLQVVVTFDADADADQLKLYLNGGLDQSFTVATPLAVTPQALLLGDRATSDGVFVGEIASVAVWNGAHSAWRVKQELNSPLDLGASDLVAYWAMDEGSGTTVHDRSPRGHDGQMQGTVQWAPLPSPIVLNGPAAAPVGGMVDLVLAESTGPSPLATVLHAPLPPTGRNGEAQKFLHRVDLYTQQRVAQAQLDANDQLAQAKQAAAAKVQAAHRAAASLMNSTRYDTLFFLRDNAIYQVSAAGVVTTFSQPTSQVVNLTLRPGSAMDSGLIATPVDTVNIQMHAPMPGSTLTVTFLVGGVEIAQLGDRGAGNLTGKSGPIQVQCSGMPGIPSLGDATATVGLYGPSTIPTPAADFAVDPAETQLFWADPTAPFAIHRAALDGSGGTVLIPSSPLPVTSIALDEVNRRFFWMTGTGQIWTADYFGRNPAMLLDVSGPSREGRWQLDVDNDNHQLYWTNDFALWTAGLDGSSPRQVLSFPEAPFPIDVAVDGPSKKIYWTDKELKMVRRANMDGTGAEDLYAVEGPMRGLALDQVLPAQAAQLTQEVYWCTREEGINPDTPGITGYWPLSDGSGDRARNALLSPGHAAVIAPLQRLADELPPGMYDPAFSVRVAALGDRIAFPQTVTDSLIGSSFTIELWARPDAINPGGDIALFAGTDLTPWHCLHFVIRDGPPYFGFYGHDTPGKRPLRAGEWVHLAVRFDKDAGEQAIFVNGELDSSSTGQAPLSYAPGTEMLLGQYNGGNYFTGLMSSLRVSNRALGQDEIRDRMTQLLAGDLLAPLAPAALGWADESPPPLVYPPAAYLGFDGTGYLMLADDATTLGLSAGFTLECWVKLGDSGTLTLFSTGTQPTQDRIGCVVVGGQMWLVGGSVNKLVGSTTLQYHRWYHLAWSYDPAAQQARLLVNGVIDGTLAEPGNLAPLGPAFLGRFGGDLSADGAVSDLRIWSPVRSDADVARYARNYRGTFGMRGPVDGMRRPETLHEVYGAGAIAMVSRASAEHEQRLIAYRQRQEAQAKAAADVAAAHAAYAAQVAAKQADLAKAHQDSAASIDAKTQQNEQARADNRQRLTNAQNSATQQVSTAQSSAAQRRAAAQAQAQNIKDSANAQAQAIKDAAQANYNQAQAARAKY